MTAQEVFARLEIALAGRYRIERELGRGGMAIVYRAEDLKHDRPVALKILRPELAASVGEDRFLREIAIAAKLTHPNILPLYDSGEAGGFLYYVMPCLEGESLRDWLDREPQLPVATAVRITKEIAGALAYAHSHGLVHRDIKPSNILFQAGYALLSDFGVARAVGEAGGEKLTESGLAVGTPVYMSPEQAAGAEHLDGRSDIYSLGCVLYEMLVGEPPHTGPTPQAILARKAVEPVRRPGVVRDLPPHLEEVLDRALARVPADRFSSASSFAAALDEALTPGQVAASRTAPATSTTTVLFHPPAASRRPWRWRAAAVVAVTAAAVAGLGLWIWSDRLPFGGPRVDSLAVLPFENLSGTAQPGYLLAGMHDALIGELAKIESLRVISRTSTLRYQKKEKPLPEIARELNVDGIVEVSLLNPGSSMRVQVKLIEAVPEERHLWTRIYDRDFADIVSMYRDIARSVAAEVRAAMSPEEEARLSGGRKLDPEAYNDYLRGMFYVNQYTPDGIRKGLDYLNRANEKDPADPLPYAGLALAYTLIGHGPSPPPDSFQRAKAAAAKALELDGNVAEAHEALAEIHQYKDWDFPAAESRFKTALSLRPSFAAAHSHYGWFHVLYGRNDEAVRQMKEAISIDPLTPLYGAWLSWLYTDLRQPDLAIHEARRALEVAPNFPVSSYALGIAYSAKGMHREAIEAQKKASAAGPNFLFGLGYAYAAAGQRQEAVQVADQLIKAGQAWNTWGLAEIYTALGDKDEAFRWLEEAFEKRHSYMPWMAINSRFKPLVNDPRFQDLLRRVNVPRG